jgi:CheY-like chemotaxis protein
MAHALDDSVRLGRFTTAQIHAILDRLDALEEQSQDQKRRKTPRYSYRWPGLSMHITQPGGGVRDVKVQSRNLSAAGMSILFSGFLYNDTQVTVRLRKQHFGEEAVAGHVAWCRHITGPLHSVGIRFNARIFTKLFVDPGVLGTQEQSERVDPATMEGSVLMIDDQLMDRLLFEHQLGATKIKAATVGTVAEALAKLAAESFDIVVSDLNLAEMKGEDAFKQIRAAGYKGAMVAVTAETAPARIEAAQAAGAAAIIRKPYDFDVLMATLAAFLKDGGVTDDQLIHSTVADKPGFAKVLPQYVDGVKGLAVVIKQALDEGNFQSVRNHCLTLKGSGAGFGFAQLSEAARETCRVLDATRSLAESATLIESLLQICRRMTAKAA